MIDIDIENTNRAHECLAEDQLDQIPGGRDLTTGQIVDLARDGDKDALLWLRLMKNTDAHYRNEYFVKFPQPLIDELLDQHGMR